MWAAPTAWSSDRKTQLQDVGAGRWCSVAGCGAELAGLGPSVLLLLQSCADNSLTMVSSPPLPVKYHSIIKACKSQRA